MNVLHSRSIWGQFYETILCILHVSYIPKDNTGTSYSYIALLWIDQQCYTGFKCICIALQCYTGFRCICIALQCYTGFICIRIALQWYTGSICIRIALQCHTGFKSICIALVVLTLFFLYCLFKAYLSSRHCADNILLQCNHCLLMQYI